MVLEGDQANIANVKKKNPIFTIKRRQQGEGVILQKTCEEICDRLCRKILNMLEGVLQMVNVSSGGKC